MLAVLSNI